MRFPIRYQLMLPIFVVAVASLVAVGVLNAHLATRQTKSRIEKQLRGVIAVLAESNYPLTDAVLRQMGELANATFILTDAEGAPLASGTLHNVTELVPDNLTARTVENVSLGAEIVLGSKRYLHSWVPVRRRPPLAGSSVLHILFAQNDFDAAWRAAFVPQFLVGLVTVVLVGLVTHVVAGRVSAVLWRLKRGVERLAEGDFSDVWQPQWNDETRDMAIAVNQTAKRLAKYQAELRQAERARTIAMLGAGLAHEMRNAATGCRLAVDLHAERCRAEAADDSLDVARRQLVLMENRLQQLLHLGRERSCSNERATDISRLVSETVSLINPAAHHAGICLRWIPPNQQIAVHADSELLSQAIMNVLLNALDAVSKAQAGGKRSALVSLELRRIGEEAELVIADSGDGPPDMIAETVFEPFVSSKSEGVGLGLAVAKRVVESVGGQIAWRRQATVTEFTIRLPLAAAEVSHV